MALLLFFIFHILMGLAFIYFYGRLPKAIPTFFMVLLTYSLFYFILFIVDYLQG